MYPHRIRLRGPWELLEPEHRRVTVPCRWSDFGITTGSVRLVRRFGYPGQIDSEERVWLTFGGCEDGAKVVLNEQNVGDVGREGGEFEITSRLQQRNRLELMVESPSAQAGLGEAALEVRRTAYLRGVRVERNSENLHVTGTVIGVCEGPLDLYVLAGRSTVAYTTVQAEAGGKKFEFVLPHDTTDNVRVELVRGAVVWYAVEPES